MHLIDLSILNQNMYLTNSDFKFFIVQNIFIFFKLEKNII